MTNRLIPPLAKGHVQVWQMSVDQLAVDVCTGLLNEDERERLHRMRSGMARNEFVVGRAMLRVLLGAALQTPAAQIAICIGEFGKPAVEGIEFSVAHSHGNVLIALCRDGRVGVDVEWIDPEIEAIEIGEHSFCRSEVERLKRCNDDKRVLVFYEIWTKKEAMVKAHGQGLTLDLESFAAPEQDASAEVDGERLFVQHLDAGRGFAAALASAAAHLAVERHQLGSREIVALVSQSQ